MPCAVSSHFSKALIDFVSVFFLEYLPKGRQQSGGSRATSPEQLIRKNFSGGTSPEQLLRSNFSGGISTNELCKSTRENMGEEFEKLFPPENGVTNLKEYLEEGDLSFENEELKKEREEIRNNKVFIECVKNIWSNILKKKMDDKLSKIEYYKIMLRICKVLIPQFEIKEIIKIVDDEWKNDSKGKKHLNFFSFFNTFFELADIWTPTINANDYVYFLKSLFYRITCIHIKKKNGEIIKKKPIIMINFKRKINEKKKLSLYNDINIFKTKNNQYEFNNIDENDFIKNLRSIKKLSTEIKKLKLQFTKRFSYNLQNSFLYDINEDEYGDKNLFENLLHNRINNSFVQRNIVLLDVNDINPLEYSDEGDINTGNNTSSLGNPCELGTNDTRRDEDEDGKEGTPTDFDIAPKRCTISYFSRNNEKNEIVKDLEEKRRKTEGSILNHLEKLKRGNVVGKKKKFISKDERIKGRDEKTKGKDEKTKGKDDKTGGKDEKTGGKDEKTGGKDEKTGGKEMKPLLENSLLIDGINFEEFTKECKIEDDNNDDVENINQEDMYKGEQDLDNEFFSLEKKHFLELGSNVDFGEELLRRDGEPAKGEKANEDESHGGEADETHAEHKKGKRGKKDILDGKMGTQVGEPPFNDQYEAVNEFKDEVEKTEKGHKTGSEGKGDRTVSGDNARDRVNYKGRDDGGDAAYSSDDQYIGVLKENLNKGLISENIIGEAEGEGNEKGRESAMRGDAQAERDTLLGKDDAVSGKGNDQGEADYALSTEQSAEQSPKQRAEHSPKQKAEQSPKQSSGQTAEQRVEGEDDALKTRNYLENEKRTLEELKLKERRRSKMLKKNDGSMGDLEDDSKIVDGQNSIVDGSHGMKGKKIGLGEDTNDDSFKIKDISFDSKLEKEIRSASDEELQNGVVKKVSREAVQDEAEAVEAVEAAKAAEQRTFMLSVNKDICDKFESYRENLDLFLKTKRRESVAVGKGRGAAEGGETGPDENMSSGDEHMLGGYFTPHGEYSPGSYMKGDFRDVQDETDLASLRKKSGLIENLEIRKQKNEISSNNVNKTFQEVSKILNDVMVKSEIGLLEKKQRKMIPTTLEDEDEKKFVPFREKDEEELLQYDIDDVNHLLHNEEEVKNILFSEEGCELLGGKEVNDLPYELDVNKKTESSEIEAGTKLPGEGEQANITECYENTGIEKTLENVQRNDKLYTRDGVKDGGVFVSGRESIENHEQELKNGMYDQNDVKGVSPYANGLKGTMYSRDVAEDGSSGGAPQGKMGTKGVAPGEVATEEVTTEGVAPEDVARKGVATEEVTTEEVTTEGVAPEDVARKGVATEEVTTEGVAPEEVAPEEVVPEEVAPEEVVPEDVASEEVVPEDVAPEDVVPEDVEAKTLMLRDTEKVENEAGAEAVAEAVAEAGAEAEAEAEAVAKAEAKYSEKTRPECNEFKKPEDKKKKKLKYVYIEDAQKMRNFIKINKKKKKENIVIISSNTYEEINNLVKKLKVEFIEPYIILNKNIKLKNKYLSPLGKLINYNLINGKYINYKNLLDLTLEYMNTIISNNNGFILFLNKFYFNYINYFFFKLNKFNNLNFINYTNFLNFNFLKNVSMSRGSGVGSGMGSGMESGLHINDFLLQDRNLILANPFKDSFPTVCITINRHAHTNASAHSR
ncbi:hypothetical protein POVWA1_023210 [Plasmodium ovale wallikeri]|uniref:Uncharacterized protein n=1 Tax=Plasmodium ovale wallikeri TaxID=864142 RepID=A0A1A8YSK7_PLAOA|nr:hypothetical protein POVWA1_023210 [Plasmodium ovale wallikeri]